MVHGVFLHCSHASALKLESLKPDCDAVEITRRAQHVLARPLCDVATLQRVQTHGAVARDASVPRDPGCEHVRSV